MPLQDEEKIADTITTLDGKGKITYMQLEAAKLKIRLIIQKQKEAEDHYYKLARETDNAEKAKKEVNGQRKEAERDLEELLYKWQNE